MQDKFLFYMCRFVSKLDPFDTQQTVFQLLYILEKSLILSQSQSYDICVYKDRFSSKFNL